MLRFYERKKHVAVSKYPGWYLLVQVRTLRYAVGDPSRDDKGGYADAFEKFRAHFGDDDDNGQYFGTLIPKQC